MKECKLHGKTEFGFCGQCIIESNSFKPEENSQEIKEEISELISPYVGMPSHGIKTGSEIPTKSKYTFHIEGLEGSRCPCLLGPTSDYEIKSICQGNAWFQTVENGVHKQWIAVPLPKGNLVDKVE